MTHRISIEIDGRNCIGLDVGDRVSRFHMEDAFGKVITKDKVKTQPGAIAEVFGPMEPARIALEAGAHSPWISELLGQLGHEVVVANTQRVALIAKNFQKDDDIDTELLCWLRRVDPKLLFPIRHRDSGARVDLALIRSRDALVRSRTQQINYVRGAVKPFGARIPSNVTPGCFHNRARSYIPAELKEQLSPHLEIVAHLTSLICAKDKEIRRLCRERYPETKFLLQVNGVGPITALSFVLTIDDPSRFASMRDVGAYLGMVPKRRSSGDMDPELSITKAGDGAVRRLLVQCAHHILGWRGVDSDLRRWGLGLAARGKKAAKKRAVVAVARKLSVLLLSLWVNKQEYVPLREEQVKA